MKCDLALWTDWTLPLSEPSATHAGRQVIIIWRSRQPKSLGNLEGIRSLAALVTGGSSNTLAAGAGAALTEETLSNQAMASAARSRCLDGRYGPQRGLLTVQIPPWPLGIHWRTPSQQNSSWLRMEGALCYGIWWIRRVGFAAW